MLAGCHGCSESWSPDTLTRSTDGAKAPRGAQEQIFDSYGRRSNDELLLLYGFSLPQNIHNFVELLGQGEEVVHFFARFVWKWFPGK